MFEVTHVRKHTAKGALFLSRQKYDLTLSGEYLGGTSTLGEALLINVSGTYRVHDTLSLYAAVDNLLNTSYELTGGGYPMPGCEGTARRECEAVVMDHTTLASMN